MNELKENINGNDQILIHIIGTCRQDLFKKNIKVVFCGFEENKLLQLSLQQQNIIFR
jgi:hypothetical protein